MGHKQGSRFFRGVGKNFLIQVGPTGGEVWLDLLSTNKEELTRVQDPEESEEKR